MQKKFIWPLAILLICVLACTVLTANAGARESISMSAEGSEAEVTLEVPQEMVDEGERVVSLQLSFQVDAKQGNIGSGDVSFQFHEGIGSGVKEQRYDPQSGVLNIYISGGSNLYSGTNIPLGKVVLKSGSGSGTTATVRVVPDSLKTINAAHGTREHGVNAPGTATLVTGDGGQAEVPETPKGPEGAGENKGDGNGLTGSVVGNYTGNVTLGSESQNGGNTSQGMQRPIHVSGARENPGAEGTEGLSPEEVEDGSGLEEGDTDKLPDAGMSSFQKKLYAVETDAWIKIFIGVMAVAALVIVGISLVMLLGGPQKRRKVRRKPEESRLREEIREKKQPARRPPQEAQERKHPARRPSQEAQERKQSAKRPPEEARERRQPAKRPPEEVQKRRQPARRPPEEVQRRKGPGPESESGQIAWKQGGAPQRRRRRTSSQGTSSVTRR